MPPLIRLSRLPQIDDLYAAREQVLQLQADIAELRLRVDEARAHPIALAGSVAGAVVTTTSSGGAPAGDLDALRALFVTNEALAAVAGELQGQIYRLRSQTTLLAAQPPAPSTEPVPDNPADGQSTLSPAPESPGSDLVLLHHAVASLQALVAEGAAEWRAALQTERADRALVVAALHASVANESKERSTDLDELADDIREQVRIVVARSSHFLCSV